jgi:hypothetical protein
MATQQRKRADQHKGVHGIDIDKFENPHQIGGIQIATVGPAFGGGAASGCRVALVNTGSGLRYTVALDRGGDIVEASFNQHSLTFLAAGGLKPPSFAYNRDMDWLSNWAGGLVTTCGPHAIGGPHEEDGVSYGLHGHYSNTPAKLEMLVNPDPRNGKREMLLSMVMRDSRVFGPDFEIRRQIQSVLGESQIVIYDQVTNCGDQKMAHHWLYHVNLGYPLLDEGARFIYRGRAEHWQRPDPPNKPLKDAALNKLKRVEGGRADHVGVGERGMIVEVEPDEAGLCHAGLINSKRRLGLELEYSSNSLPRLANWQHYGPRGCYVSALEPFNGSLLGREHDTFSGAAPSLAPGQTKKYQMTIKVHTDQAKLSELASHDGRVRV